MTELATYEIAALGWAALLAVVQMLVLSAVANTKADTKWFAGPRDTPIELPPLVGRLTRAQSNMFEALVMFTPAALAVTLLGASSGFTATCATVFVLARIVYIPLYAFGVPFVRSAVWLVGFLATALMLLAALLF